MRLENLAWAGLCAALSVSGVRMWLDVSDHARRAEAGREALDQSGSRVEAIIIADDGTSSGSLSEVADGNCRLVVVGARSCVWTEAEATRWTVVSKNDALGTQVPEDWKVFWVMAEEDGNSAEVFGPDFPVSTYHVQDAVDFIQSAGVFATPLTLVLDRDGQVVASTPGGTLPAVSAFRSDCTIAPPDAKAPFRGTVLPDGGPAR